MKVLKLDHVAALHVWSSIAESDSAQEEKSCFQFDGEITAMDGFSNPSGYSDLRGILDFIPTLELS